MATESNAITGATSVSTQRTGELDPGLRQFPIEAPQNERERSVDRFDANDLKVTPPESRPHKKGERFLATRGLPIVKGSYRLIADYTDKRGNHLYLIDKRDNRVVARYVADGGRTGNTQGGMLKLEAPLVRPTYAPSPNQLRLGLGSASSANGPGPTGSMGIVKLRFHGYMYLHGVSDALVEGDKVSETVALNRLGVPHSMGCYEMSNPNVVELVERFGISSGSDFTVLKNSADPATKEYVTKEAERLLKDMHDQGLGDRPLSAGTDLLVEDSKGPGKYISLKPYTDLKGVKHTNDLWWVRLWQRRQAAGV